MESHPDNNNKNNIHRILGRARRNAASIYVVQHLRITRYSIVLTEVRMTTLLLCLQWIIRSSSVTKDYRVGRKCVDGDSIQFNSIQALDIDELRESIGLDGLPLERWGLPYHVTISALPTLFKTEVWKYMRILWCTAQSHPRMLGKYIEE